MGKVEKEPINKAVESWKVEKLVSCCFLGGCNIEVEGCYIKERKLENRGKVGREKIVDLKWEDI